MELPTLKQDLEKLLIDIEGYSEDYKDRKHQDGDKICEAIYRGKHESYSYIATKINNLLKWHATAKRKS